MTENGRVVLDCPIGRLPDGFYWYREVHAPRPGFGATVGDWEIGRLAGIWFQGISLGQHPNERDSDYVRECVQLGERILTPDEIAGANVGPNASERAHAAANLERLEPACVCCQDILMPRDEPPLCERCAGGGCDDPDCSEYVVEARDTFEARINAREAEVKQRAALEVNPHLAVQIAAPVEPR